MLNDANAAGIAGNENKAEDNTYEARFARNHNFLAACAATIMERYGKAKAATRSSLEDLRVVGETLNDAKETLKDVKGGFGKWCEEAGFPFDKTWRARLMKLAANWDAIIAAVEALPEDKQKWSVDGVLAIWAAAEKAKKAEAEGDNAGWEGEGVGEPKAKAKKETEAERLRRLLAEALAEVKRLKAENAALKGGAKAEAKAKPNGSSQGSSSGTVDAATKARAKKVWGLYTRGGTDGEKSAARSRIEEMAAKFSMDFDAFVKACGLAA